jgi:hypothetical protein
MPSEAGAVDLSAWAGPATVAEHGYSQSPREDGEALSGCSGRLALGLVVDRSAGSVPLDRLDAVERTGLALVALAGGDEVEVILAGRALLEHELGGHSIISRLEASLTLPVPYPPEKGSNRSVHLQRCLV